MLLGKNTIDTGNLSYTKEVFRTCNVLPFSCTHLALWRESKKNPRYMQNQKDSRISLDVVLFDGGEGLKY